MKSQDHTTGLPLSISSSRDNSSNPDTTQDHHSPQLDRQTPTRRHIEDQLMT
jgi:hypothetical protein